MIISFCGFLLCLIYIYIFVYQTQVVLSQYVISSYRKQSLYPSQAPRANIRVINFTYNHINVLLNCGGFDGSKKLVHPNRQQLAKGLLIPSNRVCQVSCFHLPPQNNITYVIVLLCRACPTVQVPRVMTTVIPLTTKDYPLPCRSTLVYPNGIDVCSSRLINSFAVNKSAGIDTINESIKTKQQQKYCILSYFLFFVPDLQ